MTTSDPATTDEPTTSEPTTSEPTTSEPTSTDAYSVAAEIQQRVELALAATSDAAQLAVEAAALPPYIARTVLRALSQAHRHLSDADTMTSPQAVGAAVVVQLSTAEPGRRVICSCGLAFTPAGWELHLSGQSSDERHQLSGELVDVGNRARRRAVEVLLGDEDSSGRRPR